MSPNKRISRAAKHSGAASADARRWAAKELSAITRGQREQRRHAGGSPMPYSAITLTRTRSSGPSPAPASRLPVMPSASRSPRQAGGSCRLGTAKGFTRGRAGSRRAGGVALRQAQGKSCGMCWSKRPGRRSSITRIGKLSLCGWRDGWTNTKPSWRLSGGCWWPSGMC